MAEYPNFGWATYTFFAQVVQLFTEYWWIGVLILAAAIYAEHNK